MYKVYIFFSTYKIDIDIFETLTPWCFLPWRCCNMEIKLEQTTLQDLHQW